mmetsp:Transcript_15797/g.29908  ORF Transcript_15797/g.29908 Transcript_15797/m.29908 type:complete len:216 (+) Transcript_15797:297-944(+)
MRALNSTDVGMSFHSFSRYFGGFVAFWSNVLSVFCYFCLDDTALQDLSIILLAFSAIESFLLQHSNREVDFNSEVSDRSLGADEQSVGTSVEKGGGLESSPLWIPKVVLALPFLCSITFLFSLAMCSNLRIGTSSPLLGAGLILAFILESTLPWIVLCTGIFACVVGMVPWLGGIICTLVMWLLFEFGTNVVRFWVYRSFQIGHYGHGFAYYPYY